MASSSPSTHCCDGCGLPKRTSSSNNGRLIPLRRCSRCQNAYYHDAACQKRHFPAHRKHCVAVANADAHEASVMASRKKDEDFIKNQQMAMYYVERREGRGRCAVAARAIKRGERISPRPVNLSSPTQDFFSPLVPPVLTVEHRKTRCSLCFSRLEEPNAQHIGSSRNEKYPVLLCSRECRWAGDEWLQKEVRVFDAVIRELPASATILPTAVLLHRLLVAVLEEEDTLTNKQRLGHTSSSVRCRLDNLQTPDKRVMSPAERNHQNTTVSLSRQLLFHHSGHSNSIPDDSTGLMSCLDPDFIISLLGKIKINAFSICDGESNAIGLGLFLDVTNMNHSCGPNVLQTFLYGQPGQLPKLLAVACRGIGEGDEICLGYVDTAPPSHVRQEALEHGYGFKCQCRLCSDSQRNDARIGFRCLIPGCTGKMGRLGPFPIDTVAPSWICDSCGSCDVSEALDAAKAFELKTLKNSQPSLAESEYVFMSFRRLCLSTSWYVRESGERFLSALLDASAITDSDMDRQRFCSQALSMAGELIGLYTIRERKGEAALRHNVLRFKAAKLRLFVDPDPSRSLAEMQDVHKDLLILLPKSHELIRDLVHCMAY